jgi:hypothetical protein
MLQVPRRDWRHRRLHLSGVDTVLDKLLQFLGETVQGCHAHRSKNATTSWRKSSAALKAAAPQLLGRSSWSRSVEAVRGRPKTKTALR